MNKDVTKKDSVMEPGVSVKVDVDKIVKYVCIAGVLIVAIVFIAKCIKYIVHED